MSSNRSAHFRHRGSGKCKDLPLGWGGEEEPLFVEPEIQGSLLLLPLNSTSLRLVLLFVTFGAVETMTQLNTLLSGGLSIDRHANSGLLANPPAGLQNQVSGVHLWGTPWVQMSSLLSHSGLPWDLFQLRLSQWWVWSWGYCFTK